MLDKLLKFLTGDDIFISYSRHDGNAYATQLANKLVDLKFSVYFDQWTTPPGSNLPVSLLRKLKRSSLLIVVGTKHAAESHHVRQEIAEFNLTSRPIVPIIFEGVRVLELVSRDGALHRITNRDEVPDAIWSKLVEGASYRAERSANLTESNPSAAVVERITATCNFINKSRRLFWTGITILMISALVAVGLTIYAGVKGKQAQIAMSEAVRQQTLATEAQNTATAAKIQEESAKKEAKEQMERAKAASTTADEQTKIASAAEIRATEASARAERQTSRANMNLAANFYTQSQVQALSDPRRAIVWGSKAVEAAPAEDLRRSIYSLRTAHLASEMPTTIVNTPGPIERAVFNYAKDKAVVVRKNGRLALWDLKMGRQIGSTLAFAPGVIGPIFSRNDQWIAALVPDWEGLLEVRSAREKHFFLRVWSADTAEMQQSLMISWRDGGPLSLAFSPTGDQLVVFGRFLEEGSEQLHDSLRVWDWATGSQLKFTESVELNIHWETLEERLLSAKVPLSQESTRNWFLNVSSELARQFVEIRKIEDGTLVKRLPHNGIIMFADFSPDAKKVVTVSTSHASNKEHRIWDIDSGQSTLIETTAVKNESDSIFNILDISRDGSNLLIRERGLRNKLEIWSYRDGRKFIRDLSPDELPDRFREIRENNPINRVKSFFSQDGRFVVESASLGHNYGIKNSAVRVWDVKTGRIVSANTSIPDEAVAYNLSPLNMILGVSLMNGTLMTLNLVKKQNALEKTQLLPNADLKYKTFLTPNVTQLLTVWNENNDERDSNSTKMRLFDLRSGSALWPQGVSISFNRDRHLVTFSPDGSRFVMSTYHPRDSRELPIWRMYRTIDGNSVPEFEGIIDDFRGLQFNRDGTMLISAEPDFPGRIKIKKWNALTGNPVPMLSAESGPAPSLVDSHDFRGFTRFADYYVISSAEDSRNVIVERVDARPPERFEARFADYGTSALAIALLMRAREVRLEGGEIRLTLDSGVGISIRHSQLGDQILDDRSGSRLSPLDPATGTIEDISDDGRFVVVRMDKHRLRIWETRTGQALSESLWQETEPKIVKFIGKGQILTVDEAGQKRLWYVGEPKRAIPNWITDLGEALSGFRLVNQTELQPIPQDEYGLLRQRYLKKLQQASESGDVDAQAVWANLQP